MTLIPALTVLALAPTAPHEDLEARLQVVLERYAAQERVNGIAVAIDLGDQSLFSGALGHIHFGGNAAASVERPMPAACLMDLLSCAYLVREAQTGDLDLHAPLGKSLQGFTVEGHELTLHHLMTHTSGLAPAETLLAAMKAAGDEGPWSAAAGIGLESSPGSCAGFQDSNLMLINAVIEARAGRAPLEVLDATLLPALGVTDGGVAKSLPEDLDEACTQIDLGGRMAEDPTGARRGGAGRLLLSAADLARVARGLSSGRTLGGGGWAQMSGVHRTSDGHELGYAYGLARTPLDELRGYAFGGANGHEWVHAARYPDLDLSIGVVADAQDLDLGALERDLCREVFDLPSRSLDDRQLPEGLREACVGNYQFGCDRIEVRLQGEGGRLTVHGLGSERELLYQGGKEFAPADGADMRLVFRIEGEIAVAIVLVQRGTTSVAVRITP